MGLFGFWNIQNLNVLVRISGVQNPKCLKSYLGFVPISDIHSSLHLEGPIFDFIFHLIRSLMIFSSNKLLRKAGDSLNSEDSPFGELTQRLVAGLMEENIMTPIEETLELGGKKG